MTWLWTRARVYQRRPPAECKLHLKNRHGSTSAAMNFVLLWDARPPEDADDNSRRDHRSDRPEKWPEKKQRSHSTFTLRLRHRIFYNNNIQRRARYAYYNNDDESTLIRSIFFFSNFYYYYHYLLLLSARSVWCFFFHSSSLLMCIHTQHGRLSPISGRTDRDTMDPSSGYRSLRRHRYYNTYDV